MLMTSSQKLNNLKQTARFYLMVHFLISKTRESAGLIVNWLGREATQILTSVDAEINSTGEVFATLEKGF